MARRPPAVRRSLAGARARLPAGVLVAAARSPLRFPCAVGDFVDGYGGVHHATNMGRILRPDGRPSAQLAPHPGRLPRPVGHRRGVGRHHLPPCGQVLVDGGARVLAPTDRLDIELEAGLRGRDR